MNVANVYRKLKQILKESNIALVGRGLNEVDTFNKIPAEIDRLGTINRLPYFLNNEMSVITEEDLEGITNIKDFAFYRNENLEHITIPDSVTSVGSYVARASAYWYNNSNWTDGLLYSGRHLLNIKSDKDGNCAIKDGTLTIAKQAAMQCTNIDSVTIPDSVIDIGPFAFGDCTDLDTVVIGSGVSIINTGTFSNCSTLSNITIPDNITTIGDYAFFYCKKLYSIRIPSSVNIIGNAAFNACSSLNSIFLDSPTPPILGNDAISPNSDRFKIYVPLGSGDVYKNATNWSRLSEYIFERSS